MATTQQKITKTYYNFGGTRLAGSIFEREGYILSKKNFVSDRKSHIFGREGFTLVEMILTMGIIVMLLTISSLLLTGLIPKASLVSASEQLIAELRQQQLETMVGEVSKTGSQPSSRGIKIEPHRYIFFEGEDFDPEAVSNYEVSVEEPLSLETDFDNQILVFALGSGEIIDYQADASTITIKNSSNQESVSIKLNDYGVVDSIN